LDYRSNAIRGRKALVAWSLAVTAPNREFVTARKLAQLDFDYYLFKIRRRAVFRG
jgi:hypothetical protein